jgi:3-methyladenine DNA glycosylase AlkD
MSAQKQKTIEDAKTILKRFATKERAVNNARFFKTGPGEYGEGDLFMGVTVPQTRKISKLFTHLSLIEIKKILQSPYHEERLLALLVLIEKYQLATLEIEKAQIVKFYLSQTHRINNWDLVDVTAYKIIGEYCLNYKKMDVMDKLIKSKIHWERRMGMVSTLAFIRANKLEIVFKYSQLRAQDQEDLMHKACGWMLREAGKKNSEQLRAYIKTYGPQMNRTTLRYAIERFPKKERDFILLSTRSPKKRIAEKKSLIKK